MYNPQNGVIRVPLANDSFPDFIYNQLQTPCQLNHKIHPCRKPIRYWPQYTLLALSLAFPGSKFDLYPVARYSMKSRNDTDSEFGQLRFGLTKVTPIYISLTTKRLEMNRNYIGPVDFAGPVVFYHKFIFRRQLRFNYRTFLSKRFLVLICFTTIVHVAHGALAPLQNRNSHWTRMASRILSFYPDFAATLFWAILEGHITLIFTQIVMYQSPIGNLNDLLNHWESGEIEMYKLTSYAMEALQTEGSDLELTDRIRRLIKRRPPIQTNVYTIMKLMEEDYEAGRSIKRVLLASGSNIPVFKIESCNIKWTELNQFPQNMIGGFTSLKHPKKPVMRMNKVQVFQAEKARLIQLIRYSKPVAQRCRIHSDRLVPLITFQSIQIIFYGLAFTLLLASVFCVIENMAARHIKDWQIVEIVHRKVMENKAYGARRSPMKTLSNNDEHTDGNLQAIVIDHYDSALIITKFFDETPTVASAILY